MDRGRQERIHEKRTNEHPAEDAIKLGPRGKILDIRVLQHVFGIFAGNDPNSLELETLAPVKQTLQLRRDLVVL